jgi:patatin-like phospholipase/acyl hydrolase
MGNIRRVLSLDGGGSLAGMLALALGRLYGAETPGREIIRQFDVVAGNSGGSIVLTALCCNYTPQDIVRVYADPASVRQMYSPRWAAIFKRILPLRILFPPYSSTGKAKALNDLFDRNRQNGEPAPRRSASPIGRAISGTTSICW